MSTNAAVAEAPFWLEVNRERVGCWTCTPEYLEALAAGWLLSEGYLDPEGEIPAFEALTADGFAGVRVELPAARAARGLAERRHRREHGCGPLHVVRCAPELVRGRRRLLAPPDAESSAALLRGLFAASGRDREPGGLHSAALSDGRRLLFQVEEVGRHNAVDKVIGRALLAGADFSGLGLVLSARVSGEIAHKAARAGLAWVASRSVPTTLALQIAEVASLPVLARAAGKERRLYGAPGPEATG